MNYNSKHGFGWAEQAMIAITSPLNNHQYAKVKKHYPEAFVTLKDLCLFAGVDVSMLDSEIVGILDNKISSVCRAGSRFFKDCVCVQLYEDAEEIMVWAIKHGALVCVTHENIDGIPCIVVEDTAAVYAKMCSYFRMRNNIPSTAIAGSIGKTTAKKMIKCVYETEFNVFCDAGNDNQIDGVGYISQHIPKESELWIQEVSEDTSGCMVGISEIVRPSIAVITAIDKAHIEEYGGEQGILDEIHSICNSMDESGFVITSYDEENTRSLFSDRNSVVFVSLYNENADYYAKDIKILKDGLHFVVYENKTNQSYTVFLKNVFAKHNVYSALLAFAAGSLSGVSKANIIKGLNKYHASGIRQNVYSAKGMLVYADCYNAVAKSIKSAVEACDSISVFGKRIAVIGDVEEAGDYSKAIHKEIVQIVNESKFDYLVSFGNQMKQAIETSEIRDSLITNSFVNKKDLNKYIKSILEKDGLILFKASHKSRLDHSIASVFPLAYIINTFDYYWPQVIWRLKIIRSWTL